MSEHLKTCRCSCRVENGIEHLDCLSACEKAVLASVSDESFLRFLRQAFAADFHAWRATGGKRTSAATVCPEDLLFEVPE